MTDKTDWLATATIGVVTALPVEFAAAWQVLECRDEVHTGGRTYRAGTVQRRDIAGTHTVVICCLNDMGNVSATAGTMMLLGAFKNIEAVIMCGIAGCVPNPSKSDEDVRLGDIIVPTRQGVVQYDHESVKEWEVEIRARPYLPSVILLGAARQLAAGERVGDRPWDRHIARSLTEMENNCAGSSGDWCRPPLEADVLQEFSANRIGDYIKWVLRSLGVSNRLVAYGPVNRASDHEHSLDRPKVFHGVIASASKLQRNTRTRTFLRKKFGAMAIDMESAGVGEAAFEREVDFFAVRSASDYCNETKNIRWHPYCALVAAAFTRALVEITQLPRLSTPSAGPTTAPTEIESAQNIEQDLARTVDRALEEHARGIVEEIKRCLDTWEFRRAFSLADNQDTWLEQHKINLPKQLVLEMYASLVRVEIVRANQNRAASEPANASRADYYLAKARNVSGR